MISLALAAVLAQAPDRLIVDGRLGVALLTRSRSSALTYLLQPELRLGARVPLGARWELGGALVALLSDSEHYRVWGAVAQARFAVWCGASGSLGLSASLGAGHDADILHEDLRADGSVAPYGGFGADARWSLGDWLLGPELGWQNLSMFQLGLAAGRRF